MKSEKLALLRKHFISCNMDSECIDLLDEIDRLNVVNTCLLMACRETLSFLDNKESKLSLKILRHILSEAIIKAEE